MISDKFLDSLTNGKEAINSRSLVLRDSKSMEEKILS